ncbi:MAG TPA: hypothetical protein VH062_37215 [Polyangiaceae bacterium]|nr:hypothetical protein [Polyangiaceae bacterium]
MTKLVLRLTVSALLASLSGCSTSPSGTADVTGAAGGGTTHVTKGCTPDDECGACASCFDECLCGGGTTARCTKTCSTPPPAVASADAGKPTAPSDSGAPKDDMPATFVADGFDIPPGGETFQCQNFENPYGRDVAVLSSEAFMTVGSHHMFLFLESTNEKGPLVPCSGLSFGTYVHLAQKSESRIDYPPGVGMIVHGSSGFQIMVHYLNSSSDPIHAVVAATLHATEPANVAIHAGQIFANTLSVSIPPRSMTTVTHSCGIPKDVNLFTAASHMHSHGVHYIARDSDGQLLYETKDWAEPEPWTFTPPRLLKAGSTIDVSCDYDNETDQALSFGESAATNEMCIFVGGYYPAADDESITCLF